MLILHWLPSCFAVVSSFLYSLEFYVLKILALEFQGFEAMSA